MSSQEGQQRCPFSAAAQRFDPFSETYLQDPYPHLRAIREQEPVFYSPALDYWVIARYEDVQRCFFDQDEYSASIALDTIVAPFPSSTARTCASVRRSRAWN